jgi:hypothetical protein
MSHGAPSRGHRGPGSVGRRCHRSRHDRDARRSTTLEVNRARRPTGHASAEPPGGGGVAVELRPTAWPSSGRCGRGRWSSVQEPACPARRRRRPHPGNPTSLPPVASRTVRRSWLVMVVILRDSERPVWCDPSPKPDSSALSRAPTVRQPDAAGIRRGRAGRRYAALMRRGEVHARVGRPGVASGTPASR